MTKKTSKNDPKIIKISLVFAMSKSDKNDEKSTKMTHFSHENPTFFDPKIDENKALVVWHF
jgi:hypothetical protein